MTRSIAAAIVLMGASLIVCLKPSMAEVDSAEHDSLEGRVISEYGGQYSCIQGITGLTIQFLRPEADSQAVAIFKFGPSYSNQQIPRGAFLLRGAVNFKDGLLDLRPLSWISQPPGYSMVGLSGTSSDEGKTFNGKVLFPGCSSFSITRGAAGLGPEAEAANEREQKLASLYAYYLSLKICNDRLSGELDNTLEQFRKALAENEKNFDKEYTDRIWSKVAGAAGMAAPMANSEPVPQLRQECNNMVAAIPLLFPGLIKPGVPKKDF
jgi:hypothetical protein